MKTLLALSAAGLLFVGCSTNLNVDSVAARLEIVAEEATRYVLIENPEDRVKFEKALVGLKELEASGKVSVDSIVASLQAAGIDDLSSTRGRLIIATGSVLFYDYTSASSQDIDRNLLPIVKALRSGIERSL